MTETQEDEEYRGIKDPDGYVQERRLKQIFDLKDELNERRLNCKLAESEDKPSAVTAYRAAATTYFQALEPLFMIHEPGPEVYLNRDFGSVVVEPRVRESDIDAVSVPDKPEIFTEDGWKMIEEENIPNPIAYDLTGLVSLFEIPDPIVEVWSVNIIGRGFERSKTLRTELEGQVQFKQIDRMVRAADRTLAEIGFEIEPEEEDNPAQI